MDLQYIGVDPNTGGGGSPTIWVDQGTSDLVLQGWRADDETESACAATEIPGHTPGIPAHETVIRIPARMVPLIRKACDVAERGTT